MNDDEPLSDYEERLRHALHHIPTPESDADDVLARVEHGVRRRVRRRRAGAAGLGVAAVLAAAAVVVPTYTGDDSQVADDATSHPDGNTPSNTARSHAGQSAEGKGQRGQLKTTGTPDKQSAGNLTDPSGLSVSAIATNDSGAVSLIGESTCPDGPCVVTGSPDGSGDYRIAPTGDRLLQEKTWRTSTTVSNDAPGIQVGSDPSNSWAWTDAFYSTHDSGKTWKSVELPASLAVEDVQSNNGRVWAFGERADGRPAVASSAEHSDNWVAEPVPVHADESIKTPMVVADRLAFVADKPRTGHAELVSQRAGGWDRRSVPCPEPVKSTTARDTVWLGCRTPNGADYVAWSHDRGTDWNYEVVNQPGLSAVGGVDDDTAVAAAGDELLVLGADGTERRATTPYDASDDVWDGEAGYDSIRMGADGTGYATTNGGALARTDDGGNTWKAETLP